MPWNLKENPPESRRDGRSSSIHAVHRGPETPGRESRSWRAPPTQLAVQRPPGEPRSREPGAIKAKPNEGIPSSAARFLLPKNSLPLAAAAAARVAERR
ncbi:hypothetical protein SORBI_3006G135575 [Sorghum bicolor]|uniref:Uncharacterized protein n=1 Tax=Sorghum bicolor TaxID=4558 RepID=A0A1Z5RDU8_SORBI|nr:hypothetical protein SORBI_3006G135575 [Sorghum bicolor]